MKITYIILAIIISFSYLYGEFTLRQFRNNFDESFPGCIVSIYGVFDTTQVLDSIKVIVPKEMVTYSKEKMGRTNEELIYSFKQDVIGTTLLTLNDWGIYSNQSLIEQHFNPNAKVILIIKGVKRTYAQLADWINIFIDLMDLTFTSGTTERTEEEKAEFRKNIDKTWK